MLVIIKIKDNSEHTWNGVVLLNVLLSSTARCISSSAGKTTSKSVVKVTELFPEFVDPVAQ